MSKALDNIAASPLLPTAVIVGAGFIFFKKELGDMFHSLNPFGDSAEDTANKKADIVGSPWSPKFYNDLYKAVGARKFGTKGTGIIDQHNKSKEFAQTIYDALGALTPFHLSDDDAAVISVFKQLQSKAAVALIAEVFYLNWKKDLFNFIQYYLNSDNMSKVIDIVKALPIGVCNDENKIIK